jgi:hypothetical protein
MSTRTRKTIPEQIAEHRYADVPRRASALHAPDTDEEEQEPLTSTHQPTPRTTASTMPRSPRRIPPDVQEDDEDIIYETRPPSSTRRYKPPTRGRQQGMVLVKERRGLPLVLVLLLVFVGILLAVIVPPLWQEGMDQWHYGFPRTYQVDANVGHGTAKAPLTHFIAINNHGLIEVLEIPTGIPTSASAVHLYVIAQIDGEKADQAAVTITFQDENGDGKLDLIVHCGGNEYVLYNAGQSFQKP